MLKQWRIQNFKSFKDETCLDLAPITILAGANSSGKSSIIQSMLLLKQTLQYVPATRAIGLNGPLLKLGRFDDIHNSPQESEDIRFCWRLDNLQGHIFSRAVVSALPYTFLPPGVTPSSADFEIKFGVPNDDTRATEELSQLQPVLKFTHVRFDFETAPNDKRCVDISLKRRPFTVSTSVNENTKPKGLAFDVDIDERSRNELFKGRPDSKIVGGDSVHFLPRRVGIGFNQHKLFAKQISELLTQMHLGRIYIEPQLRNIKIPPTVAAMILGRLEDGINTAGSKFRYHSELSGRLDILRGGTFTVQEFLSVLDQNFAQILPIQAGIRSKLAEVQPEIEKQLMKDADLGKVGGQDFGLPNMLELAIESCNSFFLQSLYYLGPLRDEPRPIYPLEAVLNPTDVGYKGEHTAAVLDLHRDTIVYYIPSQDMSALSAARPIGSTLGSAVKDWLSYLGVAESVSTVDRGKMGHTLQVRVGPNRRDHDLTHVGVGVSQLLPIVVMALLAPQGALLIFEQPELHLHPKVQARLADFFLSLSLAQKQCILETHSEYLVERFRLRIAQASGNDLSDTVKIYFTHKEKNETKCREVKITRFGAVIDWPDDFFDQAQQETQAILRAGQNKHKLERQEREKS